MRHVRHQTRPEHDVRRQRAVVRVDESSPPPRDDERRRARIRHARLGRRRRPRAFIHARHLLVLVQYLQRLHVLRLARQSHRRRLDLASYRSRDAFGVDATDASRHLARARRRPPRASRPPEPPRHDLVRSRSFTVPANDARAQDIALARRERVAAQRVRRAQTQVSRLRILQPAARTPRSRRVGASARRVGARRFSSRVAPARSRRRDRRATRRHRRRRVTL